MKTIASFFSIILIFSLITNKTYSQSDAAQKGLNAISKESVKAQLEFLSSDWMEGRATGEKGEFLAADYLASMLLFMEISPAGDKEWTQPTRAQRMNGIRSKEYNSYFQNIYMTKQLESSAKLSIITNQIYSLNENVDFSISGSANNIQLKSKLIFVGYGFTDDKSGYDDFKGLDVKNKIIVRVDGFPGHKDTNSLAYKKFHKNERYFDYYLSRQKDKQAQEKGVIAIINISDQDYSKYWSAKNDFNEMDFNESPNSPIYQNDLSLPSDSIQNDILRIYINKKTTNLIMQNEGLSIERFEKQAASSLKPQSKVLKNTSADIDYKVKSEIIQTRNVLGVIEGENKDEIIVIGGHYDHLGIKDGFIWNGADDNASGTVGVWMLAKAFAASGIKPKKTIVFAAWTGEEKGLLGSKYFVKNPYSGKIENIKFYLNFDMISKDDDTDTLKNQARMVYTSSLSNLEEKTKSNIKNYNLNLDITYRPSEKPRGGSDHSSFSEKTIPIMYFMAGFPDDYHTPTDETDDVNWDKMVDIIKLSFLNVWEIVNKE